MTLSKSHYALILPHSLMYFPQSSAQSQSFKTKKKKRACLLSPFEDSMSHLINTHHVPRDRRRRTQRARVIFASFLLFTDSIKQRGVQRFGPSVLRTRVPLLSMRVSGAVTLAHGCDCGVHRYLRKDALFGVWSTVGVQLGFVADYGIWIQTL